MTATKVVKQDRAAGLEHRMNKAGRYVAIYDNELAMSILERIAAGERLKDICSEAGMPNIATFRRWGVNEPALARAYDAAVKMSAAALEEDALGIARDLANPKIVKKLSGTEVRAYEIAMNQFRWSASRRDPSKFGEKAPANIMVPIQINTNMDLGGGPPDGSIYTLKAKVATPELPDVQLVPDPKPWNEPGSKHKRVLVPPVQRTLNDPQGTNVASAQEAESGTVHVETEGQEVEGSRRDFDYEPDDLSVESDKDAGTGSKHDAT